LQGQASAIFAGAKSSSRADAVARYQDVLQMKGNAARGAQLFATNCATCHSFGGVGTVVGPNIAELTDKSTQALLIAVLDPNAAVDARYKNYSVETRDGRSISGIIASETATSVVMASADGRRQEILRSDIGEIRASNLSLMPEGFEAILKPQDLADIIAHLQGVPNGTSSSAK